MMKKTIKMDMKTLAVVFCLVFLITGFMVYGAIQSVRFDRLVKANLLQKIRADIIFYRVSEIEYVLFFEKKSKDKYLKRKTSALQQLEQKQRVFEPLLRSDEEKLAYSIFRADCDHYMRESKVMLALLKEENPKQQAIVSIAEKSRAVYEKSIQMLDMLIESQIKHPISWSELIKKIFSMNRLAISFLYVCGMSALLILIFNFYDKVRKRCS